MVTDSDYTLIIGFGIMSLTALIMQLCSAASASARVRRKVSYEMQRRIDELNGQLDRIKTDFNELSVLHIGLQSTHEKMLSDIKTSDDNGDKSPETVVLTVAFRSSRKTENGLDERINNIPIVVPRGTTINQLKMDELTKKYAEDTKLNDAKLNDAVVMIDRIQRNEPNGDAVTIYELPRYVVKFADSTSSIVALPYAPSSDILESIFSLSTASPDSAKKIMDVHRL